MPINLGVLCSGDEAGLAALIEAIEASRLPGTIGLVVADRDSPALDLARWAGLQAVFLPRTAFHANRDGFERRLVELFRGAKTQKLVLAGFEREVGEVLAEAFPGQIHGAGLGPGELVEDLTVKLRASMFHLTTS